MSYGLTDAEIELQELAARIAELQKLQERYMKVAQFIELGKQLSASHGTNGNGRPPVVSTDPPTTSILTSPSNRKWNSADFAARVLRDGDSGVHLDKLIELMRSIGWVGSGDQKRDRHNVGVMLTRNERFQNIGSNTWILADRNKPEWAKD